MSESILGQLLDEKAQRDAIHIAIAPVVAAERLYPGDHVGFVSDGIVAKRDDKLIGIVDPFLMKPVGEGQRFFLCLYPKTVTGKRHNWEHPAFSPAILPALSPNKQEAERVIRQFCRDQFTYVSEEEAFRRIVSDWGVLDFTTVEGTSGPFENEDEVKAALSVYTGRANPDFRFSCSC